MNEKNNVTRSWGYSDTTVSSVPVSAPIFDMNNYAKIKDDDSRKEYVNLTCPTNQQEKLTFTADRVNNVSVSYKKAYPAAVKTGFQISVKDESILRDTSDDGVIHDEPLKVIITIQGSDALIGANGVVSGADLLPHVMRAAFRLISLKATTTSENATTYTVALAQNQLDRLMHGAADYANPIQ